MRALHEAQLQQQVVLHAAGRHAMCGWHTTRSTNDHHPLVISSQGSHMCWTGHASVGGA
jgi:hypothetical protein